MPPVLPRSVAALRPYALHAFLLVYTPLLLVADGLLQDLGPQVALGIVSFGVLAVCVRSVAPEHRVGVWLCVPIATLFEVYGSLIWGGYTYRLHNIPLYVPPGHALVYVFGITAVGLPLVRRHGRRVRCVAAGAAGIWAVAGLTVLPLVTHRYDVQGAILLPLLAWCILRSRRGEMFAAIWLITAAIEIAGTWAGDWSWAAVAPWSQLPSGNPPSAIAAGYAVIDGSVVLLAPLALAAVAWIARRTHPALALRSLRWLSPTPSATSAPSAATPSAATRKAPRASSAHRVESLACEIRTLAGPA